MTARRHGPGLTARLVLVLLAFGALPLAASTLIGYITARRVIVDQAEAALRELAARQAAHLATELDRQRLILRTITGQLSAAMAPGGLDAGRLARLLRQSLPEDGVFDGLRLVTPSGALLADVALRDAAPHWPTRIPAADWTAERVVVHRQGDQTLAYLVAAPLPGAGAWLEGHVRAEDFARLFALPRHLAGEIEFAIVDREGRPVFAGHAHAADELARAAAALRDTEPATPTAEIAGAPFLVAGERVPAAEWTYVAALPLRQALAPLARLRNAALAGAGALVLLIGLTAWRTARSISAPLRALAQAAQQLGRTGAYAPVAARGSGEVGVLVDAFGRMADDLRRSREEIERLHAREMERAQQLASVGELASAVAHEIRNPLTGVLGALELALRRIPDGDPARPWLAEAERQLRRMEDTTAQLLRYARPPDLRELVVDVHSVVERAVRVVEGRARAAGVRIRIEPAPAPTRVRVDPELMVQVLVNLLLNGIDAMDGGGELTVWVAARTAEVWIGVRDTGPGVPPERRAAIFKPFYTTKHHGTGLGLPISRQIVERHGGTIRVEDTPGGGATFVVTLPREPEDEGEQPT